jgi:FlaA1/EpsC-like NDP-sugar epimerase
MEHLKGKSVLVTGCCGTVGRELVKQLLNDGRVGHLTGIDNNESELFFSQQRHQKHENANFFLADMRDRAKMTRLFKGVDVVFHSAAFKHVVLCERSPFDAVQTNIHGVQNVIEAAYDAEVGMVIFTSSDKAVNPTNVMGTTKLMGERLITAANNAQRGHNTIFSSTRFGNVLGSRGSVIPIFREQIKNGGPITLTDPDMTRFIMSIQDATRLVIDSSKVARGGEVFVTKMPVIKIKDLAECMIEELAPKYGYKSEDINVEIIGSKPGEKLYEELMSSEETRRTCELEEYFAVLPALSNMYKNIHYDYPGKISDSITNPYNSELEEALTKEQLLSFLREHNLLEETE